jgi:uncharacterized membrane protein (DUF4010 family)
MVDGTVGLDVRQSVEVLAVSLGLGGLVGLQRQQAESQIAGIRTFPLITLLGSISGLVALANPTIGATLIVTGLIGVIAASGLGNYLRAQFLLSGSAKDDPQEHTGTGITTEIAILVMYAVGVYVVFGEKVVAVMITGVVVLLLYAKELLHRFVKSLGENDVRGIMQFVLLACVVLPVLPDKPFGPYQVLNPRQIWLVVVLVVGISLGGYVAYRVVGERAGTVLSGILGGLISSTATTASFARRTRDGGAGQTGAAMLAIMLASVVLYGRVLVELSAVAAQSLPAMVGPLLAMGGVTALMALVLWMSRRHEDGSIPVQQNPTNLKAALLFAAIFAAVVLATAAAKDRMGNDGLFVVAAISGLPDMDAITLSSGKAVTEGRMTTDDAWRAVLIALMSSMVMKILICGLLGNRKLLARALLLFGANIGAGTLILWLWPRS